jgi:hypothetical protein
MIDIIPKKILKVSEIKKLENYSCDFNNYYVIKKYMEEIFKQWITGEKIKNPMTIFLIRQLHSGKLDKLEQKLKNLQEKIGEESLNSISDELKDEKGNEVEVIKKLKSLQGEIIAFNNLPVTEHNNLKKCKEVGDWENDHAIISVKTILDLDLNYQLIEETIKGMAFVKENDILRRYNKIRFKEGINLDDNFRTNVINFLENLFLNILYIIDLGLNSQDEIEVKTVKYFHKKDIQTGNIEVTVNGYIEGRSKKIVEFNFQEYRTGESKLKHIFSIKMEVNVKNDSTFLINYNTNSYFEGCAIDWDVLKKKITHHLVKIDKNKDNKKRIIGWINISIHPKHECYFLENKERVSEFLKIIKCDRKYELYFCFNPQFGFNLKKSIIFNI